MKAVDGNLSKTIGFASRLPQCGDARGAVFIEFLIAFLPIFFFFLYLVQLGLLFSARIVTQHAAINTARAAAVVVADRKDRYNDYDPNKFNPDSGNRGRDIRRAALLSLSPLIQDGTIQKLKIVFPPPNQKGGDTPGNRPLAYAPMADSTVQKMRVRLEVDVACKISFANLVACGNFLDRLFPGANPLQPYPARRIYAEAIFPYQGASYVY